MSLNDFDTSNEWKLKKKVENKKWRKKWNCGELSKDKILRDLQRERWERERFRTHSFTFGTPFASCKLVCVSMIVKESCLPKNSKPVYLIRQISQQNPFKNGYTSSRKVRPALSTSLSIEKTVHAINRVIGADSFGLKASPSDEAGVP